MNTPSLRARAVRAPLAIALLLCAACVSTEDPASSVPWLVQHGRVEEAAKLAAERHKAQPDDAQAAELWRLTYTALLLDRGRKLSLANRDVEALEQFEAAGKVAPDVPQVGHWREATLTKLADQWINKAAEWHASDNLVEANACYEQALVYRPDDVRAAEGLSRVLLQLNYRRGMGEKYYQSGIEAMTEYWLEQAAHDFSATKDKFDETHERAKRRGAEVETLRADNRVLIAEGFEEAGAFSAARNEYRLATLLDPKHAAALAGLERTRKEEQASEALREADRRILKRDFDGAEKALAEGAALTQRQQEAFAAEGEHLARERLRVRYEAARALESDHRFEEAIAAYDALLASAAAGFFEDAIARRDTLSDFVTKAGQLYSLGVAASDPADQLNYLRQVLVVYPEYKDTQERVKALEAAPQPPPGEKPPEKPR